jgi:hypothetical protein
MSDRALSDIYGTMALSVTTFIITTVYHYAEWHYAIVCLGATMTLSQTTLSIRVLCHNAECRVLIIVMHAECHYGDLHLPRRRK